jgi:hypothetical protein
MRGFKMVAAALIVLLGALFVSGCGAPATQSTPPPTSEDVKAATNFLATTQESDIRPGEEGWARGIVLSTQHSDGGAVSSEDWSMNVLLADGSSKTLSDDLGSNKQALRTGIQPGDYIAFKNDDDYIDNGEYRVVKKAAITIKGK